MMESIQTSGPATNCHAGRAAAGNGGVSDGELGCQDQEEGKDLGRPGQVKTKGDIFIY